MKKIKFILIQIFALIPMAASALTIIKQGNASGDIFSLQSDSPVLMFLNISAFLVLTFSITIFMQGYTKFDLASGNYNDLKEGRETMTKAGLLLLYVIIVFIIDLSSYR